MAVRALIVLAMFAVFYGCEQESRCPPEKPEKTVVERTIVEEHHPRLVQPTIHPT